MPIASTHDFSKPFVNKKMASGVLGMIILLFTEIMFFAGLISSYIVSRADVVEWPPIGQPRLPVEATFLNTLFLLASAVTIFVLLKKYTSRKKYIFWLALTIIFGIIFVSLQGAEWVKLISYGLTTTSSLYGAFFYSIVGIHAVHVLFGLGVLFYLFRKLEKNPETDQSSTIVACSLYWYFVVAIWPILYYLVYIF